METPVPVSAPTKPLIWRVLPPAAFALGAAAEFLLFHRSGLSVFAAAGAIHAWFAVAAATALWPAPGLRFRPATTTAVLLLVSFVPWLRPAAGAAATDATLQLAAVATGGLAFGFHFLAVLLGHADRATPNSGFARAIPAARLLAFLQLGGLACLLARLYAQRNWLPAWRTALLLMLVALVAELLLRWAARFYRPARLRAPTTPDEDSATLSALLGRTAGGNQLRTSFRRAFGVSPEDTWLVRLLRQAGAPLVLAALLATWASTAVTQVPLETRGVLVLTGEFQPAPLSPGLHVHAPWPWARVELVETARVRELALGFGRDLAGPVLWNEKHFEDEQNLLVGAGEELLTFNVPVHFRVRDAVAYLRHASDASAALEALGYRELLTFAGSHAAFGLMTTDRTVVADELRRRLQADADRLELGLEIVFVGLKDVHPPVTVAPAFQDVVSAEEEQVALVDQARAKAELALAEARVAAQQLRVQADAAATERVARARGESARLAALGPAYHSSRDVLTTRLRLEATEAALTGVGQIEILPAGSRPRQFWLGGSPTAP